tara:strand:+ start:214 stop:558 length:345 start_codon:yes stop_codon:yes gene_type:complete
MNNINFIALLLIFLLIIGCSIGGYNVRDHYEVDKKLTMSDVIEKRGVADLVMDVDEDNKKITYHSYLFKNSSCKITYKYIKNIVEDITFFKCPKTMGGIRLESIGIGNTGHHRH